ncbi:MAG: glycosyltransferase family 2 protein [Lachnospiraceae bacterium]|nr:glycosyltransferase family 2 protein [Lachnospiraceae bacterium]
MDYKVSVVIPAYNAEKYVCYAVRSVLLQTLDNIEIIVVDDKSTDNTVSVLKKEFSGNENIKIVLSEKNGGVGAARNRGIAEAQGEYVAFLDSDDVIKKDALKTLYDAVNGADVVSATGCFFTKGETLPDDLLTLSDEFMMPVTLDQDRDTSKPAKAPADIHDRIKEWQKWHFCYTIWNKLFKREFLKEHGISFDHLTMAEDLMFSFKCLFFAKDYRMIPGHFTIYRAQGAESLSKQKKSLAYVEKLLRAQIAACNCMTAFLDEQEYFKENPEERIQVIYNTCDSIDTYYLIPAFEECTASEIKKNDAMYAVFGELFKENKGFAEYLFYRMHENNQTGVDINGLFDNPDSWGQGKKD